MDHRFQSTVLLTLQEATEDFLVNMFDQCNQIAIHGKRTTVVVKDIKLWDRLHDFYSYVMNLNMNIVPKVKPNTLGISYDRY